MAIDTPDQAWERLERWLDRRQLGLFLGAGVSQKNGIPTWQEFVGRLAGEVGFDGRVASALDISLTRRLSLVRRQFEAGSYERGWADLVRHVLYADYVAQRAASGVPVGEGAGLRERLTAYFEASNPVLAACLRLCAVPSGPGFVADGGKARHNPRVAAILSYNIDELIQAYDAARHGPFRVTRTIERASKAARPGTISLYQLHGYVRAVPGIAEEEAADHLVVTEQEHHDLTDDPLSFGNAAALRVLREAVCVFVGCSMTDELMRRTLRRWLREHVAALEAAPRPDKPEAAEDRVRRHFAVMLLRGSPEENDLLDADLCLSGVWPLWVQDFDEDLTGRLVGLGRFLEQRADGDAAQRRID